MKDTNKTLKQMQAILLKHMQGPTPNKSKRINYNPKNWGPPAWQFLNKIAEGYPVKPTKHDKEKLLDFLYSLGHMLPCATCRENYIDFTQKNPPINAVASRKKIINWFKKLRNKTNG